MHERERQHASECATTLVTEASPDIHSNLARIVSGIAKTYGDIKPVSRYDLLAIPTFLGLATDKERMKILIENITLAIDVHAAERVWLLHHSQLFSDEVYRRLRREFARRFPKLSLDTEWIPRMPERRKLSHRLVVTCMDFRLHHQAGLQGMFTEPSAWLTYPGAAFAGVDAKTERVFFSDLDRVMDGEAVSELTLVSHTDCAKYAAKYTWRSAKEERKQLADDLRIVAGRIRAGYSHLTVLCAIASVKDGMVKELIPVT